ncbi:MAG: putative Ig domain-containing protein [Candidatus Competibacteraceae bacterium]
MRSLLGRLKGLTELWVLTLLLMVGLGSHEALANWFSSPGGGSGGFTGRPLITVEISADRTSVPVNLAGLGPNPSLPYTSTITAVVRQDGRLFPTNIQLDLAPTLAVGALFKPDDFTQGFRSLPLESTSGLATAFFHASTTPGEAVITASAQDPGTGQTVSASLKITVVDEKRPAAAITFTGAYVNAVIAGQSRFGGAETPIQDGSYSRVISAVVNDSNGNPTNPNTQINFYLIDGPITGYPSTPGSFFIAGSNGDPVDGQFRFNAAGGDFVTKGVAPFHRLVLGKPVPDLRIIESVLSATSLAVQSTSRSPFPANTSSVPYMVGFAQNAAILSPSFTNLQGVASTTLTYPVERVGQTAVLVACTADMSVCGALNTCDVSGANCKSVYLGVTNGTDRTLTVSATTLGPNRSTDVQMCLRDVNFTPLPATEIRYNIGSKGPAKVTVNGVEGNQGNVLTGANGCTMVKIASSGQIPGGLPIELDFTSDYVATPAKVTIKSPGAGKMDGLFNCEFQFSAGTALCELTLRLTDDEGSPMPDVLIALGAVEAAGTYTLTFNPAEGVFGKTDSQGQLRVTVQLNMPGAYTFPFQTAAGGTASYTMQVNVPAPGQLQVSLNGPTEAPLGQPYSAVLLAQGGTPPYAWSLLAGRLPPGVSLSGNGTISGTPSSSGTFSFSVQATDKNGLTGFGAFTITVGEQEALEVSLNGPPAGALNVPYSGVLSATGGSAPYSFSLLAGKLPTGLTLDADGTLAGTPTEVGTFAFSVQARDSNGATGTGNFTITIASASPLTLTLQGPTATTVGANYSSVVVAAGGTPPYIFQVLAGSPPTGLILNSVTGALTGTPLAGGVFVFTVGATDSKGVKGQSTFTITVNTAQAPTIATESPLPNATPGTFYTALLTATGGTLPYSWTIEAPSTLPASLALNASTGALSGTPTSTDVGNYNFIVRVTDANGAFALKAYTLTVGSGGGGGALVQSVQLLSESLTLESSGKKPITLTALVKDSNSNLMKDVPVTFAVTNGVNATLQVVRGTTDDTGTATVLLNTGGDTSSRTITVVATGGGVNSNAVDIEVAGNKLTIAGPTTAVLGGPAIPLTLTLVDSAGQPIGNQQLTVATLPAGLATPAALTTDSGGQAQTQVAPSSTQLCPPNPPGTPCIVVTATGAGATGNLTITVSPDNFVFVTPLPAPATLVNGVWSVPLNTPQTLRVRWLTGNPATPVVGQPVTFSATRGVLSGPNPATTNASGEATIQIEANNAGSSLITATTAANGPSAQFTVLFVSTDPKQMTLQAVPTVIGTNPAGRSDQQSKITATVKDDNDNPVANRTIIFSLTDVSGGNIAPSTAVTDANGQAQTTYTAGQTPGAQNGVRVDASAGVPLIRCPGQQLVASGSGVPGQPAGPGPYAFCSVSLTAAKQELFIKLGTDNLIDNSAPPLYKKKYTVLVTDAAGGPVQNATITLSILPTAYYKGKYLLSPNDFEPKKWVQVIGTAVQNNLATYFPPFGPCANEDINRNGILDPGEDTNGNGRLDPGNVATIDANPVTTDSSGFAQFNVVYAAQFSNWVTVDLLATAKVTGSEATTVANFTLPILAAALTATGASPPGNPSPYGIATSCLIP